MCRLRLLIRTSAVSRINILLLCSYFNLNLYYVDLKCIFSGNWEHSMVKAQSGRSANTISCVSSHLLFWRRVLKKISCSCTLHIKAPFSPLNYVFCTGINYSYTMPGFSLCVMQMCCSAKTFLLIL